MYVVVRVRFIIVVLSLFYQTYASPEGRKLFPWKFVNKYSAAVYAIAAKSQHSDQIVVGGDNELLFMIWNAVDDV